MDNLNTIIVISLSFLLCGFFTQAAWHKLRRQDEFLLALKQYSLVPPLLLKPVAWCLIFIEAAIVVAGLFPLTQSAAMLAAATVLLVYALAIGSVLLRGLSVNDCGCGSAKHKPDILLILRNLFLAGGALWVATSSTTWELIGLVAWAQIFLFAAYLWLLLHSYEGLSRNAQTLQLIRGVYDR